MKQSNFLFQSTASIYNGVQAVLDEIMPYLADVQSIMDFGCGMGCWSAVLHKKGFSRFQLIDHPSIPLDKILFPDKACFLGVDLDKELPAVIKSDLVICTEVLEHFSTKRSLELLDFITDCADLILFSAAIPGQGGVGHMNEQRHAFWHNEFSKRGYKWFDGFKPALVHQKEIPFYLRQNLFFYYKPTASFRFQGKANFTPEDMELVHKNILNRPLTLKELYRNFPSALRRFIKRVAKT